MILLAGLVMVFDAEVCADQQNQISELVSEIDFKDPNFKACLGAMGLEKTKNVKKIECGGKNISSLDGIQYFINLEHLDVNINKLTSLDMNQNPNLEELSVSHNQLISLDVSKNLNLSWLNIFNNQLSKLDVSKNQDLGYLFVSKNQLTRLDISKNLNLGEFEIDDSVTTIRQKEDIQ